MDRQEVVHLWLIGFGVRFLSFCLFGEHKAVFTFPFCSSLFTGCPGSSFESSVGLFVSCAPAFFFAFRQNMKTQPSCWIAPVRKVSGHGAKLAELWVVSSTMNWVSSRLSMPYVYGGVCAILEFPENQHRYLSRFGSLAILPTRLFTD